MAYESKYSVDPEEIFDYVNKRIKEGGVTKAKAFVEFCDEKSVPEHLVRNTYYKLAKERMPEHYTPKYELITATDTIEIEPQNTLSVLSEIISISETTNINIEPVFEALLPLFRQLGKEATEGQENEKVKLQLEKAEKFVMDISNALNEFEKLPSLKKIGNLEKFCGDLKSIVNGVQREV